MNRETLKNIFKSPYQSTIWKGFLKELFRDISSSYFETPVDLKDETLVKHKDVEHIWEFGDITLSDGRVIKFYEVELKENQQVTKNRVGLRNIVSGEIGFGYIDGAIITYYNKKASDWRFTFISKSLYWDADNNEVKTETHPKRYTYLLGQNETVKTALNQFEWLFKQIKTRGIDIEDILKAFSVEKLSKEFYDGYFHQYETFVGYIVDNPKAFSLFLNQISSNNSTEEKHKKAEHLVSDFVKKFLGRIVFLFFLQKKGWMGVPLDKDWGDGQLDFLFRLFEEFPDKNDFYEKALAPLFFRTLNDDRSDNNDIFSVTNTRIPYLNGGLFEKDETEPENIQFEPQRFIDLLAFFSQYNFTVDESSPDDQDIGVDPEMLGHIFENLLEDNKDKGAFYTPKEIVHYMTQESLIEYLDTHLENTSKEDLTVFVKQKKQGKLNENELEEINSLLSKLKILDPAIGSGAFPMGLLHEIFALKGLIAFEQGYEAWSPARVKERIIENTIYGVDIEEGAVDIARLRFWLSLVVDEPTPRPLPNLDYKIICGNSLISRYDLDTPIEAVFKEFNKGRDEDEKVDLAKYKELVNAYMHEANHDKKEEFKQLIEDVKAAFKTYFTQSENNKIIKLKQELNNYNLPSLFEHKQTAKEKQRIKTLKTKIAKLEKEKKEREEAKIFKNAVEWRFEFPNLLDNEGNFEGFDIVIGNPPYIKESTKKSAFDGFRVSKYYQGKMDLWYGFACICVDLLKDKGKLCFIATNNWITNDGASILRNKVISDTSIIKFIDFNDYKVFKTAGIQTMITVLSKEKTNSHYVDYKKLLSKKIGNNILVQFLNKPENTSKDYITYKSLLETEINTTLSFLSEEISKIISKIKSASNFTFNSSEILSGIDIPQDFLNKKSQRKLNGSYKVGMGVFVLNEQEIIDLGLTPKEKEILKPFYTTQEMNRYYGSPKNKYWIIYTDSSFKNHNSMNEYPNIKKHLDSLQEIITSENKPYGLNRARKDGISFEGEKIVVTRKCSKSPTFTYTNFDTYFNRTFIQIITKRLNNKYLVALLNSKIIEFFLSKKGKMQGSNFQLDKSPLLKLPLIETSNSEIFIRLVDYIIFILGYSDSINEYVPNSHIAETFEEVIDAMVFELYFPEEFEKADITIIKFAEKEFVDIANKSEHIKKNIINDTYNRLTEKKNLLRNQIKLMKIELNELLNPILSI